MAQIITLLTDFGTRDSYVAEMKGVLLSQLPSATLVDITHDIRPYQIEEAAFNLLRTYAWFPASTFHLVVVDPGVGSNRKCLFVKTAHGNFVGPDNGVLLWAIRDSEKYKKKAAVAYEIPVSERAAPTFHGRDVFAPFICEYLRGKKQRLKRVSTLEGREFPLPAHGVGKISGEVLYEDQFGNTVTNIPTGKSNVRAIFGKYQVDTAPNYDSIAPGKVALLRGSHGFWEFAGSQDSAAKQLRLKKGDAITLVS
jgi:S-adenosyl-L-methionine hydrolase (adenosine-forming)